MLSTRLTPQTLKLINELLVQAAVAMGLEDGSKLRVDTTVVATDIHHPTDNTLLRDVVPDWSLCKLVSPRPRNSITKRSSASPGAGGQTFKCKSEQIWGSPQTGDANRNSSALCGQDHGRNVCVVEAVGGGAMKTAKVVFIPNKSASVTAAATRTIPMVFLSVADPVEQGFVPNLTHPGGNITQRGSARSASASSRRSHDRLSWPNQYLCPLKLDLCLS
jgi:hypothetical protein